MKKKFRVVKNFKIVKRPCFLNRYYRVDVFTKIKCTESCGGKKFKYSLYRTNNDLSALL